MLLIIELYYLIMSGDIISLEKSWLTLAPQFLGASLGHLKYKMPNFHRLRSTAAQVWRNQVKAGAGAAGSQQRSPD